MPQPIRFGQFRREQRLKTQIPTQPIMIDLNEVDEGDDAYDPTIVYELSPVLPAGVMVEWMRLRRIYGDDGSVPAEDIFSVADTLFPPEVLNALIRRHQLDALDMAELIMQVFVQYSDQMQQDVEASEGNAARAKPARRSTSSRAGTTSKPTSNGSTPSTSRKRSSSGTAATRG